jgi:hypothetical protein
LINNKISGTVLKCLVGRVPNFINVVDYDPNEVVKKNLKKNTAEGPHCRGVRGPYLKKLTFPMFGSGFLLRKNT